MLRSFILRSPDPDPNKPGGGGESKFTEDQLKEIAAVVGPMIAGAFKGEGSRAIAKAAGEAVKAALTKDALQPLFQQFVADLPDDDDDDTPPGDPPKPNKPDPKVAALEAKLADLTKKIADDAEALKKAQEAARDKDALAALKSVLGPHVRPEALDIAASHLFVGEKRVTFDEAGTPLFTVKQASYQGGPEEDVAMPLADGVQRWLKTPQGKFFAPAPNGGGEQPRGQVPRRVNTGSDGMPNYEKPATTDGERNRRVDERVSALLASRPDLKS